MSGEELPKLTNAEVNVLCAGLLKLRDQCPRRGQTILSVRCPDLKMRHISMDQIADLVDKLTVYSGATLGAHSGMAAELAKEVKKAGGSF